MLASTLVLLVALSLPVAAQPPPPGPPQGPHEVIRQNADELGIDDTTVDEVMALALAARPEHERLEGEVEAARARLHLLLAADEPDRKAVLRQVETLGEAEIALMQHDLAALMDMRALLTPAQRKAVEKLASPGGTGHPPPPGGGPPPGAPPRR